MGPQACAVLETSATALFVLGPEWREGLPGSGGPKGGVGREGGVMLATDMERWRWYCVAVECDAACLWCEQHDKRPSRETIP